MTLLLIALAVLVGTGCAALAAHRRGRLAVALAGAGAIVASGLGLPAALVVLRGGRSSELALPWAVPIGTIRLGLDGLTAFFLMPLFVLGALCAVYGASYMPAVAKGRSLGPHAFFFNLTFASMVLVLVARDAVVFLVAWEVMTIASYLVVSFEHQQAEVRRAGWIYLVAGHLGVACLFALFLTLNGRAGDFSFAGFAAGGPREGGLAVLAFVLALAGFGVKSGIVPVHVWLPEAHAAAPSHVSALMSGVLIKLGLYGLLRVSTFLRPAGWWAAVLIVLGLVGGLLGITLAAYQRDLKRALAYSSVENVGIILLGLGLGFWGTVNGHPRIAALGAVGALLHVWNHATVKGLLFLSAGSVLHGAGTKDLERLGGLIKRMPWTATLMIVGAVAIAGLPPLNAFASEWLIYLGLLEGGMAARSAMGLLLFLVFAGLAMMGAVAALSFARLVGIALLGQPRSPAAENAHESGAWVLGPIFALAGVASVLGVGALYVAPLTAFPARELFGPTFDAAAAAAQLRPVAVMSLVVGGTVALVALVFSRLLRRRVAGDATWGCGYLAPSARMQYTGQAFAEILSQRLLPPSIRARTSAQVPKAIFPEPASLSLEYTDPLTRSVYEPFFDRWAGRFSRLRWMQQGVLHAYLVYILVAVVAALAWTSARRWWWGGA